MLSVLMCVCFGVEAMGGGWYRDNGQPPAVAFGGNTGKGSVGIATDWLADLRHAVHHLPTVGEGAFAGWSRVSSRTITTLTNKRGRYFVGEKQGKLYAFLFADDRKLDTRDTLAGVMNAYVAKLTEAKEQQQPAPSAQLAPPPVPPTPKSVGPSPRVPPSQPTTAAAASRPVGLVEIGHRLDGLDGRVKAILARAVPPTDLPSIVNEELVVAETVFSSLLAMRPTNEYERTTRKKQFDWLYRIVANDRLNALLTDALTAAWKTLETDGGQSKTTIALIDLMQRKETLVQKMQTKRESFMTPPVPAIAGLAPVPPVNRETVQRQQELQGQITKIQAAEAKIAEHIKGLLSPTAVLTIDDVQRWISSVKTIMALLNNCNPTDTGNQLIVGTAVMSLRKNTVDKLAELSRKIGAAASAPTTARSWLDAEQRLAALITALDAFISQKLKTLAVNDDEEMGFGLFD